MIGRRWWLLLFLVGCSSVPTNDAVVVEHGMLVAKGKALTPQFRAIDSFDVSRERDEVVFSAKRDNNFDIGLVSLEGSDVHWVPEDPADEVSVQWAPRGNKVSYIIRRLGGDLVRTVHIPTATQVTADFPYGIVQSLMWDLAGERYTVTVTSPDQSRRTVSMKYDGTARKTLIGPAESLDVNLELFGSGILMRPSLLRYNERIPVVVWIDDQPLEWSDARGALMKNNRVAIAVVKQAPEKLPEEQWVDVSRIFLVSRARASRRTPWIVVPHADVESSATGWIAQRLKELNGSR